MTPNPGHRLFARYAHTPNALGYCGPPGSEALRAVACGRGDKGDKGDEGTDVPALARRFSGAWPYQEILAELSAIDDPLNERVVRGYWTGNEVTDAADRTAFGTALLARIKPQAGAYWQHLDDSLLVEAAPTHGFHVFSVYPWSRLLSTQAPEPLAVLDSCRITWATVLRVESDHLLVLAQHLEYADGALTLGPERKDRVNYRVDGDAFIDNIEVGESVAVHWGFACDRLTADEQTALARWTQWQLDAMRPRLERSFIRLPE